MQHPDITRTEQTGYPNPEAVNHTPVCPACGVMTNTYYYNYKNEIIGCATCVYSGDAWE
jgi:hypothetical protein